MNHPLIDNHRNHISTTAGILRDYSRHFYDAYKRTLDSKNRVEVENGRKAYEKYQKLETMARELDIVALGNL